MYYLYLLYSVRSDRYYLGITNNPEARLYSHNHSLRKTYTSKHRPWEMQALFEVGEDRSKAVLIERWVKRQKSRALMARMANGDELKEGMLAQLVRVPRPRD